MADEQHNIDIELSDAGTVTKAETSVRYSVLEAQKYEGFENRAEILTSEPPGAIESDLESNYEDIESSSQQHQTLLEEESWEERQTNKKIEKKEIDTCEIRTHAPEGTGCQRERKLTFTVQP